MAGAPKGNKNAAGNKGGAPVGNQNAVGNKGGAPRENINALKKGRYRKYISKTTGQIINDLKRKGATHIDILRENIYIAQGELINRISLISDTDGNAENLREIINAFNKISKMGKEYDELTGDNYSLKIEEQKLKIEKLKAEVNNITGEDEEDKEDDGFIEALNGVAKEDWSDEENI